MLATAAILMSFAVGASAARPHKVAALALAGLVTGGVALFFRGTAPVIVLTLILGATVFPIRLGSFELAGIRSDLTEAAVLGLVTSLLVRRSLSGQQPLPFSREIRLMLAAAGAGAGVALANGAAYGEVLDPLKTFAFWAMAWVLAEAFPTEEALDRLEAIVIALAFGSALVVMGSAILGAAPPWAVTEEVRTLDQISVTARIRPEALSLGVLALFFVARRAALGGWRMGLGAVAAGLVVLQILSFNRSSWVSLGAALVIYARLRPAASAARYRGLGTTLGVVVTAMIGLAAASFGLLGPTAEAAALRMRSVADPSVFEERSQQLRDEENAAAWRTALDNPIAGIGLNQPYSLVSSAASGTVPTTSRTRLLHNTYLKLWLETGLVGLFALAYLASSVRRTLRGGRCGNRWWDDRALGAAMALLAFALQAIYQTKLYHRSTLLTVGVCLAFIGPAYRRARESNIDALRGTP